MRPGHLIPLVLALLLVPAAPAPASGWSAIATPRHSGLSAVACASPSSCEAVGGWLNRLTSSRWDGTRWSPSPAPAVPKHAVGARLSGLSCRSTRSCVAVGEYFTGER